MAGPTETNKNDEFIEINEDCDKGVVKDCVEREGGVKGEEDMGGIGGIGGSSIHRSGSRPQLDLSGAAIHGNFEERDPVILLPNQSDDISHLALDIGGSLIKLVYFSRHEDRLVNNRRKSFKERLGVTNGGLRSYPILGGRLHFVKFETRKMNECLDFIHSKQLHCGGMDSRHWRSNIPNNENAVIKLFTLPDVNSEIWITVHFHP